MSLHRMHRELVSIPSISGQETQAADYVQQALQGCGDVWRIGDNVAALKGSGPLVLLCSHIDTVPPNDAWTRDPWQVDEEDGRVWGLGSNDAKASVAAMIDAFQAFPSDAGLSVGLLLAAFEETGGDGVELAWPVLQREGWDPVGVVVGEPTDLQIAVAQRGLLILELHREGDACHSANAASLGARNPIAGLARDLVALEGLELGPEDPHLGRTTLQPTVIRAGEARNQVPGTAQCCLDLRTVPTTPHDDLIARVQEVVQGEVRVRSKRLVPTGCSTDAAIVRAAQRASPRSSTVGSRTMSDMVWFDGWNAIKCGPGVSARSHRPDEFVRTDELQEGAAFYRALLEGMVPT